MKALIIRKPWIDYILDGKKEWEIRGSNTKIRGRIELIQSRSGLIVGSCDLIDCQRIDDKTYHANFDKHFIPDTNKLPYRKTYAWILSNPQRYKEPKKYCHPNGAIVWVNINDKKEKI